MKQRVRLHFTKQGDLVWISHHDLMRLWERVLRRSGLPIRMTEGAHPRPRVSLPLALGIGVSSDDEVIEIEMDRWMTAGQIAESLAPAFPEGMKLRGMEAVAPSEKGQVERVDYELPLASGEVEALAVRLAQLGTLDRLEVVRQRNQKTIDLKPYLLDARIEEGPILRFSFRVVPEGTARPEEFCQAVGLDIGPMPVRIRKLRTVLAEEKTRRPPDPAGGARGRGGPRRRR